VSFLRGTLCLPPLPDLGDIWFPLFPPPIAIRLRMTIGHLALSFKCQFFFFFFFFFCLYVPLLFLLFYPRSAGFLLWIAFPPPSPQDLGDDGAGQDACLHRRVSFLRLLPSGGSQWVEFFMVGRLLCSSRMMKMLPISVKIPYIGTVAPWRLRARDDSLLAAILPPSRIPLWLGLARSSPFSFFDAINFLRSHLDDFFLRASSVLPTAYLVWYGMWPLSPLRR